MAPTDFKIEKMNRQESRKLIHKIVTVTPKKVA